MSTVITLPAALPTQRLNRIRAELSGTDVEVRLVQPILVDCASCSRPGTWQPGTEIVFHEHGRCRVRGGR